MKIPYNWIKEYVDTDIDVEEYSRQMVMTGTAVEGVARTGEQFDKVVVGRVLSCEMHPNSDHLHVCMVDVGKDAPLQIVCGAPNVAAGQLVATALEGAHLPGGKIKKGKLRGVESCGMLCSGPELDVPDGLYPHVGDAGIIVFNEEYAPGTDVKEVFGLGDSVVDFEILANRPDCLSVWGIARESAAVLDRHFIMPEISVEENGAGSIEDYAKVIVEDSETCPRYCAKVITNVRIGRSPKWMREYLYGAGVRPINNIVDITNFVMLETGHPMHAFDLNKVKEQTIVVRRARSGEKLVTLDGKEHMLTPDMLVIADKENATGLAGIMGGEESEITEETHSVLFECAAFERSNNRITARKLGIRTEASGRFEKGVCPATAMEALERACMLVNQLDCGDVVKGCYDIYPNPAAPVIIKADVSRICRRNGVQVSGDVMEDILNRLCIDTELSEGVLTCHVPAYRQDIETDADIAEEVLRMYGYDHIPSTLMNAVTMPGRRSDKMDFQNRIKHALIGLGLFEILNYSFISPSWINYLGIPESDWRNSPVMLRNPLGEETSAMRTTLVPSMLMTIAYNINHGNSDGALYEVSKVFEACSEKSQLPIEHNYLSIGMFGHDSSGKIVDFYSLKRVVEWVFSLNNVKAVISATGENYYHPGRKAEYLLDGKVIARLGEIHPDVAQRFDIDCRVYVAEIDMDALQDASSDIKGIVELPKFPAVTRDIALVVKEAVGAGTLSECIRQAGGKTLEDVHLFDVYRGERLGDGLKSLAYSLTFRAADRTLTDVEINGAMDKVLRVVKSEFDAQLRS